MCLAVVGAGVALIWWFPAARQYYTDADTIREPAATARTRDILWQPPRPLSEVIDTSVDDYEPKLSADGMTLYFVRGKAGGNADIFVARRTAKGWTTPESLEAVNSVADELGPEPSPDGLSLYFYSDRPGGIGGYDLWVTHRGEAGWRTPINLGPYVNSPFNEYGPAVPPEGDVLYFASNRPGPDDRDGPDPNAWPATIREDLYNRDYDLFFAALTESGPTAAEPLTTLNTPYNEGAPAVSSFGDFLYFSSDRPGGHGGFDLYRARRLRGSVLEATNLGPTLNTAANEMDPGLSLGGYALYFSSDREIEDTVGPDKKPTAGGTGDELERRYSLFWSTSREVFSDWEHVERATIDWAALWSAIGPNLLWALLALLLLLALLALLRDVRARRLSLLAKCLLASLVAHLLLMLIFNLWEVSASLAREFRRQGRIQVALAPAMGNELARQFQAASAPLDSTPAPVMLPNPRPIRSEASDANPQATLDVARLTVTLPETADKEIPLSDARPDIDTPLPEPPSTLSQVAPQPTIETAAPPEPERLDEAEPAPAVQAPTIETNSTQRAADSSAPPHVEKTAAISPLRVQRSESSSGERQSLAETTPPLDGTPPILDMVDSVRLVERAAARDLTALTVDSPSTSRNKPVQESETAAEALPLDVTRTRSEFHEPPSVNVSAGAYHVIDPTDRTPQDGLSLVDSPPSPDVAAPTVGETDPLPTEFATVPPQLGVADFALPRPGVAQASSAIETTPADLIGSPHLDLVARRDIDRADADTSDDAPILMEPERATSVDVGGSLVEKLADAVRFSDARIPAASGEVTDLRLSRRLQPARSWEVEATTRLVPSLLPIDGLSLPSQQASEEIRSEAAVSEAEPLVVPPALQRIRRAQTTQTASPPSPTFPTYVGIVVPTDRRQDLDGVEGDIEELLARAADSPDVRWDWDRAIPELARDRSALLPSRRDFDLPAPSDEVSPEDPYAQRRAEDRLAIVERMGGSEDTERAVTAALQWLARHQSPDGRWDGDEFDSSCGQCGGETNIVVDHALTGLALLAFLGAGHTHVDEGPYQANVARGLEWLLAQQQSDGDLRGEETMYSQGIATIALSEAFGMSRDQKLAEPVRRAVEFIDQARNRDLGGWRYDPGQAGDTSVLGWQVMALKSAAMNGLPVPVAAFKAARRWFDLVDDASRSGLYAYRPGRAATPSMTAEGMFSQQLLGLPRHDPRMETASEYILDNLPDWESGPNTYYWYYATLAMFQHQGEAWERWNSTLTAELLAAQNKQGPRAGSWDPRGDWADIGGRVYQTALCTLMLEVYYRYLPLYGIEGAAEPIGAVRGFVTDADTGRPLRSAVVRLDLPDHEAVSVLTGGDGGYVLSTPALPDYFALTAAHRDYIPTSKNVSSAEVRGTTVAIDFALQRARGGIVAIEAVPAVHHLGDDRFDGRINSQFQKESEGSRFATTFHLTTGQSPPRITRAELRLLAKGVQRSHRIRINDRDLEQRLEEAPSDGSFGEFVTPVDSSLLRPGTNTFEIIAKPSSSDIDDFEFVNVQLHLFSDQTSALPFK